MRSRIWKTSFVVLMATILLLTPGLSLAGKTAPGLVCRDIFVMSQRPFYSPKWWDLLLQQTIDARQFTSREIKRLNRSTREALASSIPYSSERASSISYSELDALLNHVRNHPLTAIENRAKYQPEDVDIGYCFARATQIHLLLLKMGLDKRSIAKIWAVGPQVSGREKNWDFHVAVTVYVRGYGWMTIDSNIFKIQPLEHWFSGHEERSVDGKLRIYVTEADKFGVSSAGYDRMQLGLDLNRSEDWYRGYFTDMMRTIRGKTLEDLGLPRIKITPPPEPQRPTRSLLDRIFIRE